LRPPKKTLASHYTFAHFVLFCGKFLIVLAVTGRNETQIKRLGCCRAVQSRDFALVLCFSPICISFWPGNFSRQDAMQSCVDDEQLCEIESLRALVQDKEQALRQAQERVNDFERDWLYTSCRNFRGTLSRIKERKARIINATKIGLKLIAFVAAITVAPIRAIVRVLRRGPRSLIEHEPEFSRLRVGLTAPLPESVVSSKGNSFLIGGWAFHRHRRIRHLELRLFTARPATRASSLVDDELEDDPLRGEQSADQKVEFADRLVPIIQGNLPNREVLTDHFPAQDSNGNSFWSEFYALVTLPPMMRTVQAQLMVKATLEDGTVETAPLGGFTVRPSMPAPAAFNQLPEGTTPLIAVCMTTYNPPPLLFRRQIDSIRDQTYERWICIIRDDGSKPEAEQMIRDTIADDPRFVFRKNDKNLGFYKNFEAVLADTPTEAEFIALSDQDDRWHPDKLETLLRHMTPGISLVYSDTNIVDETGRIWANTYWTTRDNNCTHYPTLLLANTITGAASMIRRNLLEYLLPFPEKFGDAYHDHWLGCTAMAVGYLCYVNRPLYDYTQHAGNVIGHVAPKPGTWSGAIYRFCAFFWPPRLSRNISTFLRHGRGYYFADLLRMQQTAHNVLLRCHKELSPDKKVALERILTMADTWSGWLWLAFRPLGQANSWRKTVGVESNLLQALCWRAVSRLMAWWGTRLTACGILRGTMAKQRVERPQVIDHIDTVAAVTRITAPLSLAIREKSPPRLNVIISIIDFRYVFGGYITVFHLCRKLALQGFRVRVIVVDECDFRPVAWADSFRTYPGLEDFLDRIELIYAFDRKTIVPVSPHDTFLATSWWTAHVAHLATKMLNKQKFVYLIQEYEPGFYAYSSLSAFAAESYDFPHYALFSTEILREFFGLNRCGIFAGTDGDRLGISFENAITAVGPVMADELRAKRVRRLLFYCRPEPHALRNMFDTGLIALRNAVKTGAFRGWEFHGIGTMAWSGKIKLANGITMDLLPRLNQESYRNILKDYDVGLSLMCSPHPSLVPLEMAKAGMWTVTNCFANKTAAKLKSISSNFLPTSSSVEGVTRGLCQAWRLTHDFEARANGTDVKWATNWDQAFSPEVMDRLSEFILAAMEDRDIAAVPMRRAA
jgi:glycosyltransferase involved in cell wall biosynthesis